MIEAVLIILTLLSFPVVALVRRPSPRIPSKELETFTLGTRNHKSFAIGAGISMSFVGGAAMLNMASLGYQFGWSVLIDPLVVMLALLIAIIIASRIRSGKGVTISGLLSQTSPKLTIFLGATSFGVYQLLTAAQFVAVGKLLTPYFPGVPFAILVVIPALIVFFYIYLRGFESVTTTDVLQLILILTLFAVPVFWIIIQKHQVPEIATVDFTPVPITLLIYLSLPLFFVPVSHDTNIRIKAAASLRHAKLGLFLGGLFYVILVTLAVSVGVYLRKNGHLLESPEKALPIFFDQYLGPIGIVSVVAVLAAIISTLDSFSFDAIVSAGNDLLKPLRGHALSERKILALSTGLVLTLALVIALFFQQILGLILAGMLLYVSIFIPVALGRLLKVKDGLLLFTCSITAITLIGCKIAGYTPPVEPLIFTGLHLVLIITAKLLDRK